MALDSTLKNLENLTGLTLAQIRSLSPSELRKHIEKKNGKGLSFVSEFPFIGRGNVLRDGLTTSSKINSEIDSILGIDKVNLQHLS